MIQNIQLYKGMNRNLDTAIDFLVSNGIKNLSTGRTEIDGDDVYVNVSDNITVQSNNAFEAHGKYADIHLVISGSEKYAVCQNGLSVKQAFDPEKDVALYNGNADVEVVLTADNFVICLPEEAHAPGLSITAENKNVRKAVFKVRV
jgi:YhcH/YjgK/YiaL family protein